MENIEKIKNAQEIPGIPGTAPLARAPKLRRSLLQTLEPPKEAWRARREVVWAHGGFASKVHLLGGGLEEITQGKQEPPERPLTVLYIKATGEGGRLRFSPRFYRESLGIPQHY